MQVDVGFRRFRVWYVEFHARRWLYFLTIKFYCTGGPSWLGCNFGLVMDASSGESRCSPSAARGAGRFFLDLGVQKWIFQCKKPDFLGVREAGKIVHSLWSTSTDLSWRYPRDLRSRSRSGSESRSQI